MFQVFSITSQKQNNSSNFTSLLEIQLGGYKLLEFLKESQHSWKFPPNSSRRINHGYHYPSIGVNWISFSWSTILDQINRTILDIKLKGYKISGQKVPFSKSSNPGQINLGLVGPAGRSRTTLPLILPVAENPSRIISPADYSFTLPQCIPSSWVASERGNLKLNEYLRENSLRSPGIHWGGVEHDGRTLRDHPTINV